MKKIQYFSEIIALCCLSLAGCTPKGLISDYKDNVNAQRKEIDQAIKADKKFVERVTMPLPDDIAQSLMPEMAKSKVQNEEVFNLKVTEMPAQDFFTALAVDSPYNIIVQPSIVGNISLNLHHTTVLQVLEATKELYGFQYQLKPFGYEISKPSLISKIFSIDHLNLKRTGTSGMTVNEPSGASNGGSASSSSSTSDSSSTSSSIKTEFSEDSFWKDLQTALAQIIGAESSNDSGKVSSKYDAPTVTVDGTSGLVYVRALPIDLEKVSRYIEKLQQVNHRQVVIEAKVLEVNLNKTFSSGINWSDKRFSFDNDSGTFSFYKTAQSESTSPFATIIKFLSTQGKITVLSSPRISTVNNQQAVIKVGNDQYYVTGYNTTASTSTGSTSTLFANPVLQAFFNGVSLDVTPTINSDKQIRMHIHPTISYVTSNPLEVKVPESQGSGFTLPTAVSKIRESDSIVQAESGQVIIIGGLLSSKIDFSKNTIPGLENFELAPGNNTTSEVSELVILLRPIVVEHKTWVDELEKVNNDGWMSDHLKSLEKKETKSDVIR